MEVPGVRMEIEDNRDLPPHVGRTVGELRSFLETLPDEALIVWSGNNQNRLILVQNSEKTTVYISEATE